MDESFSLDEGMNLQTLYYPQGAWWYPIKVVGIVLQGTPPNPD